MEEEYKPAAFAGHELKYVTDILTKYFDASGFEFYDLMQRNRDYYYSKGVGSYTANDIEFFKDKNIRIDYEISLYDKIEKFTTSPSYLITESKQDTVVWLLFQFYKWEIGDSTLFNGIFDTDYYYFDQNVRRDMLTLYKAIQELFTDQQPIVIPNQDKPLKIIYGKKEVKLNNNSNWFFKHLHEYLTTFLEENTLKNVEEELQKYVNRVGAKSDYNMNRIITQLYHFLQEETPYKSPEKRITDNICTFIVHFLEILDFIKILPDEEEGNINLKKEKTLSEWIRAIRTRIHECLKKEQQDGPYKSLMNQILSDKSFRNISERESLLKKYW